MAYRQKKQQAENQTQLQEQSFSYSLPTPLKPKKQQISVQNVHSSSQPSLRSDLTNTAIVTVVLIVLELLVWIVLK